MKCFYHSADLDGHCSGALVKMAYPNCDMIGINYGDEFPWVRISEDSDLIFMVDFSLQPFEKMVTLQQLSEHRLVWIDHHISAICEHKDWNHNHAEYLSINGIRKDGIGACALVYGYLTPLLQLGIFGESDLPLFVKLLAEYDVWNHSDPRTLAFQYGMRQFKNTYPDNQDFWLSLFDTEEVQRITEVGSIILNYQISDNEKYARACAFEIEIDGLKCIAINKGLTNSQLFDSVWDPDVYDAMLSFIWRKGQWTVSLYSDKDNIDVSEIAKARGGGGHKGASGFQCKELPFKLI